MFLSFCHSYKIKNKKFTYLNLDYPGKDDLLKVIFMLPFSFKSDEYTNVDFFFNKYEKIFPEFINYFKRQWLSYFKNGYLKNLGGCLFD